VITRTGVDHTEIGAKNAIFIATCTQIKRHRTRTEL